MIHEYALEPQLVSTWGESVNYRLLYNAFGLGTRRIVAKFPSYWKRLVFDAFTPKQELDRIRLLEILRKVCEVQSARPGSCYDPDQPWLVNATTEDARMPFYSIWAQATIDDRLREFEAAPDGLPNILVDRRPGEMGASVRSLLRMSKHIVFVDPHFNANRSDYRRSFLEFFRCLDGTHVHTNALSVRIQVTGDEAIRWDLYGRDALRELPRLIPSGLSVTLTRWKECRGGEKLHNRYVLTDVGGVQFGIGLDAGIDGQTDDLTILSRESYVRRWDQYGGPNYAFDVERTIAIVGTR